MYLQHATHREGLEVGLLKALLVAKHAADGARPARLDAQCAFRHACMEERRDACYIQSEQNGNVRNQVLVCSVCASGMPTSAQHAAAARQQWGQTISGKLGQEGVPVSSRFLSSHRQGCTPKNGSEAAQGGRRGEQCAVGPSIVAHAEGQVSQGGSFCRPCDRFRTADLQCARFYGGLAKQHHLFLVQWPSSYYAPPCGRRHTHRIRASPSMRRAG